MYERRNTTVGSFVPACSAKLHVLDGIYTRMGASDSIQHGSSTFFEELGETSHILKHCTSRSLVIIDELGRGTSTHDGVAIAYATLHYLLHQKKCLILFVTHYPQILDIQNKFDGSVGAYHVSYLTMQKPLSVLESRSESDVERVDKQEVTFLYKVVHGASDKSFGLNVARLAQLPQSCIRRAAFLATKLETDACLQIENLVKFLAEKPQERPKTYENPPDPPKIMHLGFEEMTKACRRVFYSIKSALHSAEGTDRISLSLKEAQELARIATKRSPEDFPPVEPQ